MFRASTRESAVEHINALIRNLPLHIKKGHFEDALRMVDRAIGGLLGHWDSPVVHTFQSNKQLLFPGGLERTFPGKDLILILNSVETKVTTVDKRTITYTIPKTLRNPEKGVAQIIGIELAQKLFLLREQILSKLLNHSSEWKPNLEANQAAQCVLDNYANQIIQAFLRDILVVVEHEIKVNRLTNALALLDRGMQALLAQEQSKMSQAVKRHSWIFANGIISSKENKDLIAVLTGEEVPCKTFFKSSSVLSTRMIPVPKELKNPAKGILNILGKEKAILLFERRENILSALMAREKKWVSSLKANKMAKAYIEQDESPSLNVASETKQPVSAKQAKSFTL